MRSACDPRGYETKTLQNAARLVRREVSAVETGYEAEDLLGRKPTRSDDHVVLRDRLRKPTRDGDFDGAAVDLEDMTSDLKAGHRFVFSDLYLRDRTTRANSTARPTSRSSFGGVNPRDALR
jgi:hypothetical protein